MTVEGFTPFKPEDAALYSKKRWWLGLTMGDTLDKAADLYPAKEALIGADSRYTYAEFRDAADRMAYNLLKAGLEKGDFVLLQLPNIPEFVIAYYAIQKVGAVMVLLTVNHTAREIVHLAGLTQPKAWIVQDRYRKIDYLPLIDEVKQQVPGLDTVVLHSPKKVEGHLWLQDFLATDADPAEVRKAVEAARPDPGDVCQILPSGGTTGLPKGAPRTHDDYLCNVEYKSKAWDFNVTDRVCVATTVGHNLALVAGVTPAVFHGASMVMLDSTRPEDLCAAVQAEKCTCTHLVPTLVSRLLNFEGLANYDLSSLKKIYVGAANSPPDLVKGVEAALGVRYINAFGMVEGPCSQSRPDDSLEVRCNTIGRPVCPYDEFRTLDPQGKPTPPGVEGELAAKGPGIFTGYYKNPQANQDSFTPDGFFRTGDLAVIDEKGYVRITGRIKDIIIRGGENIAARDVEDLISSHPAVEYVACVGMPDYDLGELVCAYIKKAGAEGPSYEDIVAHMESLNAPKALIPARIEVVDDLPLTAAGKADKKLLKADIEAKLKAETGN